MLNNLEVIASAIVKSFANPLVITSTTSALISLVSLYISLRALRRTIRGQRLSLFLEFRSRAISDQTSADIAEIARLMLKNQLKIDPNTYSPAAGRVLNHLEWIGYFNKRRLMSNEHVWSTFGSDVLNLYPGLFDYMCKMRTTRKTPGLWRHVDFLYKRIWRYAKRNRKFGGDESRLTHKMRAFLPKHKRNAEDIELHLRLQISNRQSNRP